MEITQDVFEYAKEQNVAEEKALAVGMAEKAKMFVATSSEIYQGFVVLPKMRTRLLQKYE